jgi:hypothetical protein
MKFYCLFVISENPINSDIIQKNKGIRHLINEDFDLEADGGWLIRKKIPNRHKLIQRHSPFLISRGNRVSSVILNWLIKLVNAMNYFPEYQKQERHIP